MEIHWISRKGKLPGTTVSKEGHADNVLGHETKLTLLIFFTNWATIIVLLRNKNSSYQLNDLCICVCLCMCVCILGSFKNKVNLDR